jgi:hypothetical protein
MNPPTRESWARSCLILAAAAAVAAVSAHDYAGGWNDGSRLATVESLVDHHTWVIDDSIFVRPSAVPAGAPAPYPASSLLRDTGTLDKLLIDGHFYSDKSPTPSLWLAAVYAVFRFCTGWTAATHADAFCYVLTLASSGLAYVVAVWSIWRLGRPLGLPHRPRLLLTAVFALATVALPYVRHVNNHILLLGVLSALMAEMAHMAHGAPATKFRMLWMGLLAGLSYGIDVGTGPLLLGGAAVWLAWRCGGAQRMKNEERRTKNEERKRSFFVLRSSFFILRSSFFLLRSLFAGPCLLFLLTAAPWVLLHHGLNYMIGGTLGPANANAAYLDWPGSPWSAETMTGAWGHTGVFPCILYALDLLGGKQGFIGHNLVLGVAITGCLQLRLCRRPSPDRPLAILAVFWCVGTWLLYSVGSTNHSGVCCSVRWFVPLLAPGFYILALWLRDGPPAQRRDFVILSAWGAVLGALMWWVGPWTPNRVPGYWAVQIAALTSLLVSFYLRWRDPGAGTKPAATVVERKAA